VSFSRLGSLVRLAGEVVRLESEFGARSIESLLWIATTVEASVYVPRSLTRTPTGLAWAIANPPLRVGAFSEVRILIDGAPVPKDRVRLRTGPARPWRSSSELSEDRPLELQGGVGVEFEADGSVIDARGPRVVRMEFQSVAIPPLVWLEIRDRLREAPSA
jgi:hypothetical protein